MDDGLKLTPEEIVLLRFGLWKERRYRIDRWLDVAILDRLDGRLLDHLTNVLRDAPAQPDIEQGGSPNSEGGAGDRRSGAPPVKETSESGSLTGGGL